MRLSAFDADGAVLRRTRTNANFTILAAPIPAGTLGSPNGGETLEGGADLNVMWGAHPDASSYRLHISYDGGATWTEAGRTGAVTSYQWTVPYFITDQTNTLMRISSFDIDGNVLASARDGQEMGSSTFSPGDCARWIRCREQ